MRNIMKKPNFLGLLFPSTVHLINRLSPRMLPSTAPVLLKDSSKAKLGLSNLAEWRLFYNPLSVLEAWIRHTLICLNDEASSPNDSKILFSGKRSESHSTYASGRTKSCCSFEESLIQLVLNKTLCSNAIKLYPVSRIVDHIMEK